MLVIDIETDCGVDSCKKDADCRTKDKHALVPHESVITCIGWLDTDTGDSGVDRDLALFKQRIEEWKKQDKKILNHETKFDIKMLCYHLYRYDLKPSEALIEMWEHDTKLLAYCLPEKIPEEWLEKYEERRVALNKELPSGISHRRVKGLSLKTLAPYFLNVPAFWEDPASHDNDEYVLKDVEYTWKLYSTLEYRINEPAWQFYINKQMPWAKELLRAEITGVAINNKRLNEKKIEAEQNRGREYNKLFEQWADYIDTDFNFNSTKQLQELLRDKLGYNISKKVGRDIKESTDKEVLQRLAAQGHEDVQTLLDYRRWDKLCRTYYPSYDKFQTSKGRIHCTFNPDGTRTGRLSSSAPNLQNQPATTREIFIPDPGHKFVILDLSAIEPALIGYFSGDDNLLQLLKEGGNFHNNTTPVIFPYVDCPREQVKELYPAERGVTKTVGLSVLYGTGAKKLQSTLEKEGFQGYSLQDCKRIIKDIRNYYKGVWEFKKELDFVLEKGKVLYNLLGRPMKIDNPDDVYMKGFNRLIQGSASDIVQNAFHRLNKEPAYRVEGAQALITIHDEIVAQAPKDKAEETFKKLSLAMTDYDLTRKNVRIKLQTEGGIFDKWEKD